MAVGVVRAQLPQARLSTIIPPGGKIGTDVEITASGADLDEASGMRFSHAGITAKLKTASPAVFTVSVGKDVPAGVYECRIVGKFGISNPRAFAVGDQNEVIARPGITSAATALDAAIGSVITGTIDNNASAFFKLTLKAGQRVLFHCVAREIDSPLEPVMVLLDASGHELDHARRTALIDFTAPADGNYILKLHDAIYRGSSEYLYRLSVGTAPHIDFVMPPCGMPGTRGLFVVYGRNLPGGTSANIKAADGKPLEQLAVQIDIPADSVSTQRLTSSSFVNPAETVLDGFEYRLPSADGISNPVLITYASGAVVGEVAKRSAGQAQALSAPCEVAGQFYPRGDKDWYTFNVKKGDAYWIEVISSRLSVPSDPFMVVQSVAKSPKGETASDVQEVYDVDASIGGVDFKTSTRDPVWKLAASADGTYRVMVRDLFNESGDDPARIYRLAVRPERPDFRLVAMAVAPPPVAKDSKEVPVSSTLLRRGGTLPIRVMAHRRDGFAGEIKLETRGLPAGVSAAAAKIDAGANAGMVLLSAADNAAAWAGAISIVGTANIGGAEVLREARGASVVRTVADPANEMVFSRMTRDIAIAVGDEAEPLAIAGAEEKVFEGAVGTKVAIPLKIARPGEFKAALKLKAVGPAFLAAMKEIDVAAAADKGTLEIDTAALKIPVGAYQLYLQTQTAGKYQRNPPGAKAAEDAKTASEKAAADLAAQVKKLNEAKAPLAAAAAASGTESKKLADAVAGLAGLVAPAQAAVTAAQQKQAAAKAASDKEPAKAELKTALAEADKALAEATAKLKSATDAKEAVEKLAAAAADKAKKDAEASAAAEKAATEATAKSAEAEKAKVAAVAKIKELAAKDVTATFYSKPILLKIVTPPPATQPTTKPTTQPVKK
jgi:hypothetical protein